MDIELKSIGIVSNKVKDKTDYNWGEVVSEIKLDKQYWGGLKGLDEFSDAIIIYYLNEAEYKKENLQRRPRGREDMPLLGIFSQRGKDRPNTIGMTSVEVVSVNEDTLTVKGLDAIDGTPVIDIKPYMHQYDCKENATVPEWVSRLMKNYF